MVLPDARVELRDALAGLIAGELSNHEFDDVYCRVCQDSADRAVYEIGYFGWSLYDNETHWPYYLTGRNAVNPKAREMAERCELFLRLGLEYEWPALPSLGWVEVVQAFAVAPGCLVSLFAAMLVPVAVSNEEWSGAVATATIAALAYKPGLWIYRMPSSYAERKLAAYWNAGSKELWPFFSASSFGQACDKATQS